MNQIPKAKPDAGVARFPVSELSPQRESLEEVFIRLTEGG